MKTKDKIGRVIHLLEKVYSDDCSEEDRELVARMIDQVNDDHQSLMDVMSGIGYMDRRMAAIEKENNNSGGSDEAYYSIKSNIKAS